MTQNVAVRLCLTIATSAAFAFTSAATLEAGPRRARLSRDLAERLATGAAGSSRIIVSGSDTDLERLAARHGARVTKVLRGAAVFEVTAVQLDALSQDVEVAHLSGDVPVRRTMAVASPAIGADQVWAQGAIAPQGFSGMGIGVAVIDSGVASHPSLRGRVIASFDFTGDTAARDAYGHGTHVASIIAGRDAAYAGVAPGAHIVSLRVLNADGSG
jgi:subtilisin family serine protease